MKFSKGFTLIELVIVMALFLFITGAALGAFISIVKNQKRILSEQQFINQISYVEEYVSKALRMAKVDSTGTCLGLPGYFYKLEDYDTALAQYKSIKFLNSDGVCQEFSWDNGSANCLEEKIIGSTISTTCLTSNNDFAINYIKFSINGSSGASAWYMDTIQPRVTMLFKITVPGESPKIVQTTISQRNLNIDSGQNGGTR